MKKFKSLWPLALLLVILLAGFAPVEQGIQRFNTIISRVLTVQTRAEFQGPATFAAGISADDLTLSDDLTVTGDATLSGNLPGRALALRYQDVNAALTVYAEAAVATTTTTITTSLLGIDYPRNLVITLASDAQRSAGNIVVSGVDARGSAATEIFAMTAITDPETLTGNVPWVNISSIAIPTQTNPFTLTVAGGQKFGLPHLPQAAGDVYHLTVNATPQAAPTVNATYGTVDPVSTPAANVDYTILMRQ